MPLWRLLRLPQAFWREFLPMLAERVGLAMGTTDERAVRLQAIAALSQAVLALQPAREEQTHVE